MKVNRTIDIPVVIRVRTFLNHKIYVLLEDNTLLCSFFAPH